MRFTDTKEGTLTRWVMNQNFARRLFPGDHAVGRYYKEQHRTAIAYELWASWQR